MLRGLVRSGIIVSVSDDVYYLDVDAVACLEDSRGRAALVALAVLIFLIVLTGLLR